MKPTDVQQDDKDLDKLLVNKLNVSSAVREIIESLPEEKKKILIESIYSIEKSTSFKGPLPPPEVLREYENTLPGATERVFQMAEKQLEHRIAVEKLIVNRQTKQSAIGQVFGFILVLVFGVLTYLFASMGHVVLAGMIGTTTIVGLAIIFVLQKKPESKS